MTLQQTKLWIWLGSTSVIAIALIFTKRKQNEPPLKEGQWLGLLPATAGVLSPMQILYQAIAQPDLQKILDLDGSAALVFGSICLVWLSGREIYRLFLRQKAPG